jgi:DNA-binding HxlR family transcriptional regulator
MGKPIDCQCRAFQCAIDVLGRPWNALILGTLQAGSLRFSELSEAAHGPGDKVLSARLKELEASGLISRHVDPGPPVRVSYQLTDRGRGFNDVASAIEKWGRSLASSPMKPSVTSPMKPSVAAATKARAKLARA